MAEVQIAPSFGAELKDAYKPVNSWVQHGIAWLDDIQNFYRERSVIEKEYAAKLNALAKKYYEKKAKKTGTLSVGETPAMTPGSLESASLTTWTTQITTLESRATEHDQFGNLLVSQVAEPMRILSLRYEDIRKRHVEYAEKLEKERDHAYEQLKKTKGKYDAACQEVENKRKKAESAFDYSKAKAQNAYQQQILEMNNAKNTYLIAIRATNKQKEMYYHEYVPDLLDNLQDLNESRTAKLNGFWLTATNLELKMLAKSTEVCNYLAQEIPRNVPQLDTMMFVRHNAAPWTEPLDKAFEPSPVWHDDDAMVTDDTAKIFLRNILNKSKSQLGDLRRQVDMKRKEVEGMKRAQAAIREGRDNRNEVDLWNALLSLQEQLHDIDHARLNAEVETSTITSTIGDLTIGSKNHNFKGQTFKIPTNCDLCGERIWGLSAKGFDCRDCGYTCHSKCEMKVPAECPGEQSKEERKKLKAERQAAASHSRKPSVSIHQGSGSGSSGSVGAADSTYGGAGGGLSELSAGLSRSNTMNSLSSGYAASANRSLNNSSRMTPQQTGSSILEEAPEAATPKPAVGGRRKVLAPPPAAYISELPGSTPSSSSEPKGKMLFPYDANGADEISVTEGAEVTITEPDDGSGWVKVRSRGSEGLVPSSYLEILSPSQPLIQPLSGLSMNSQPPPPNGNRPVSSYSTASSSGTVGKKQGPAVAPKRGAKKLKYVEAMYDYSAQSPDEHSIREGDRLVLLKEDQGDGWAEVEKDGRPGSVPAAYVQSVN